MTPPTTPVSAILHTLASLRLTVILLVLSMILILAGTLAQVDQGIWAVQARYFHSFFTWIDFQLFFPRPEPGRPRAPGGFPMPGGYTLIGLLLINLLAAHATRFKIGWKRSGILLIHAGLILLLVGELATSVLQQEGQIALQEGETRNYSEDIRHPELALTEPLADGNDRVVVVNARRLRDREVIADSALPVVVQIERMMPNAALLGPEQARQAGVRLDPIADTGGARSLVAVAQPPVSGTETDRIDTPAAYVRFSAGGQDLGVYLLSVLLEPQSLVVGEKTYQVALRWSRTYTPYSLTLLDFRFDRYTGTNVPKNFSSRLRLQDPARGEDREVVVWMNNPLRYAGATFYQAGYNQQTEAGTVLQVVRNPGWLLPYISCALVGLGLVVQFGIHLIAFLRRGPVSRTRKVAEPSVSVPRGGVLVPGLLAVICVAWLMGAARPGPAAEMSPEPFARFPISYEGRVMPMDTLARTSLRIISGRDELRNADGTRTPAIRWLLNLLTDPASSLKAQVFQVDHPDLKALLGLEAESGRRRFSKSEIDAGADAFQKQVASAMRTATRDRTPFQNAVLELYRHILLFNRLAGWETLHIAPPDQHSEDWSTFADALRRARSGDTNPGLLAFTTAMDAWRKQDQAAFTRACEDYLARVRTELPGVWKRLNWETRFNAFEPFVRGMALYVLAGVLVLLGWLLPRFRGVLLRSGLWVMAIALLIHTVGLVLRVYIQGRPPVTNLYSSAVFVGWAAVLLCVGIERLYRNGVGTFSGSLVAFPTLLIAQHLAGTGDTMQMLQAVLDTNFWLATHVVVITLGYSATFLAGAVACVYVVGNLLAPARLEGAGNASLARMVYGAICFAMLFSFVGTVLGGIWADQSWGRFWGWDPKENGAALIVLWNALILHARWGGIARQRGIMLLAIFGNVVTAWSWFGTNMLGAGLHSYGFMESGVKWLILFVTFQLFLIGVGWADGWLKSRSAWPVRVRA
jgi:ABC-type transport system involved in cytochrome c biogenesis permease subunit